MNSEVCKHHKHSGSCLVNIFLKRFGISKDANIENNLGLVPSKMIAGQIMVRGIVAPLIFHRRVAEDQVKSIASNRHTGFRVVFRVCSKGLAFEKSAAAIKLALCRYRLNQCILLMITVNSSCLSICIKTCP